MSALAPPSSGDYRKTYGDPSEGYARPLIPTTRPRAVTELFGIRALPTMFEVTDNAHGVTSTATLSMPIAGNPDWSSRLRTNSDADGAIIVRLYAGFPSDPIPGSTDIAQLVPRFVGLLEKGTFRATADATTFDCTSLATLLEIDKQTTLTQNMTTTQLMTAACAATGVLPAPIIRLRQGQHALPLATVFSQDQVVGVHNLKASDLIEACAEADDVDFWVDRVTGVPHYVAQTLEGRQTYPFDYGSSLIELEGMHDQLAAKNFEVEVRLWNPHTTTSHNVRLGADGKLTTSTRITSQTPQWGTAGSSSVSEGLSGTGAFSASSSNRSSSGGGFNSGAVSIPKASSKQRYIIHMHYCTPNDADNFARRFAQRLSRYVYQVTLNAPVTPDLLKVLNVETAFALTGCPWHAFNSGPTSLSPDQASAISPLPPASRGPLTPAQANAFLATPVPDAPYYFQRRTTERFEISDGDSSESPGYVIESECVNLALPGGSSI